MEQRLVGLALTAGLVAALNPCGFALLPAYLALVVRGEATCPLGALGRALAATTAMALGFLVVFTTFGLLAVSVASTAQRYLPYATVLIGIVLVALGAWLLMGRRLAVLIPFAAGPRFRPTARIGSMFACGVGYALTSLSCTIGPFLAVTGAGIRRGPILDSLWVYLAYGAGMALIVAVLAIAVALARSTLIDRMRRMVRFVNGISGALLVLVGLYVGYYGLYEVRLFEANGSPGDRVIAAAARVQGTLAAWVHQHGPWPWVSALAVLAAVATLWSLWRSRARWPVRARRSPDLPAAAGNLPADVAADPAQNVVAGPGALPRSGSTE